MYVIIFKPESAFCWILQILFAQYPVAAFKHIALQDYLEVIKIKSYLIYVELTYNDFCYIIKHFWKCGIL